MKTSYIVEQGKMEVYGKLSKDGFNSILILLHWIWSGKKCNLDLGVVFKEDLVNQVHIDQECMK